ncbi:prolidase family protein [Syntrophotalea carbinolica DSM 2380]|uniref:Prolidase family protein n=1 Tax=Syntrophotalea carbinolica (strain DSM 2380 / NBRC 103641 / GraBd1) TaxID=338963 RepID=Q3A2N9_SYNC1|nr:aminopeptidase P family protein [Syntrophotalea carbinolica]ABA89368.1 prolidase family protein [Syntrophotalea carbinolica DSM 2380]
MPSDFVLKSRIPALRQLLRSNRLSAALLMDTPSLRYFCGFSGSDGALLVSEDTVVFLTDSRYTSQAQQEVTADRIVQHGGKIEGIAALLDEWRVTSIGFNADALSCATLESLRAKCSSACQWHPLPGTFRGLRGIKDADEIVAMKQAARIAGEAFEEIRPQIRPGAVERELALALEFAMRRRGAEEKSFPFIVASGERGALPHGVASDRRLEYGELVTFDFGARWQGYCSDETVTLALGKVSPRLREIYDTVFQAQQSALNAIKPDVALKDIDQVARSYIDQCGYGEYFGHGLGHGVGLEVHEFPVVSPRSEDVAREGMVFTVEPGIYVPGLGGVRLEETVLVTADGYQRLTAICKDFPSIVV